MEIGGHIRVHPHMTYHLGAAKLVVTGVQNVIFWHFRALNHTIPLRCKSSLSRAMLRWWACLTVNPSLVVRYCRTCRRRGQMLGLWLHIWLTLVELVRWSHVFTIPSLLLVFSSSALLCKVVQHLWKYIGLLGGRGMPARVWRSNRVVQQGVT